MSLPIARLSLLTLLAVATIAQAGPPFVSDDPEPTDPGRWEIYGFASGTHGAGETGGGGGLDINYGGAKDLQLTLVLPLDYQTGQEEGFGVGNVELAAKYKFLHQKDGTITPDVAFFPRMFVPTAGRRFGSRRLGLLLPLWAQKDIGKWSLFGGGGYDVNPGAGRRDFWLTGVGLSRAVTDRLMLGGEIYRQTADADDARRFTGMSLGGPIACHVIGRCSARQVRASSMRAAKGVTASMRRSRRIIEPARSVRSALCRPRRRPPKA